MKKIYLSLIILGGLLSFSSCNDMLQEDAHSKIEKVKFFNNADEAKPVLLGVYRSMVTGDTYGLNLSLLFPLSSDLSQCSSGINSYRKIAANAYTTSDAYIKKTWEALYQGIYRANDFLATMATRYDYFTASDKKKANIYIAEARSLRALYYFELVRYWGNIILMKQADDSYKSNDEFVQADPTEVYQFIEDDLEFAIENLPYAADDNIRDDNSFRFSKGAVLGLLTKVYATWAGYPVRDETKWEDAARTAKLLIESGKHRLLSDYEQLWKNTCNSVWDNKESLIEVSFYAPTISGTSSQDPCGRIGNWNGVYANAMSGVRGRSSANVKVVYTFYRDWEKGEFDLRRDLSIASYKYVDYERVPLTQKTPEEDAKAYQNMNPAKWDVNKYVEPNNLLIDQNYTNVNWYILRYADVLLLYAEALNESKGGPTTEAYEAVNMIRRRGFGLDITSGSSLADLEEGLSQDDFRKIVRRERAYELAFEGHRHTDLLRWGNYYETLINTAQELVDWSSSAYFTAAEYTKKGKHELYPIPQRECDILGDLNIKQNPGWN